MTKSKNKTKEQLINEVSELRRMVAGLERSETDHRRTEEELRNVNTVQSLILDNSIMGIAFVRDRLFQWANPRMSEMLGLPLSRIHGASTRIMYPSEEDYEEKGRAIYPALNRGEWFELELAVLRADGATFIGRIVGKALDPSLPQEGSIWILEDITDRKRMEENLRESEEKYRTVVEKATEGIVIAQGDYFACVNPKMADDILGVPVRDLIGKPFGSFIHPDDRAMVVGRYRRRLAGESLPDSYEFRMIGKKKRLTWVRLAAKQIQWNGKAATINMYTDVTERRQAEAALQESENWYRTFFENTGTAMVILDEDTTIVLANKEYEKLSGYTKEEVEGRKSWTEFVASEDLGQMAAMHRQRRIDQDSVPQNYEFRFRDRRGRIKNIFLTVDIMSGTKKSVASLLDITQRKKMENDLRKSEERLRSIVETSNAGIMMTTLDGKILYANQQVAGMLGYDHRIVMGKNYFDLVHPDEKTSVTDNIRLLDVVGADHLAFERHYVRRDGSVLCGYVCCGPLQVSSREKHAVIVISDITQLKQVEQEKKQLEAYLRQAQKMEAIGTLAGGIAHDFNNILASMMGFTEMAAEETRKNIRRKYHDRVLQGCARAKDLVNQILSFSRRREQKRSPLDIKLILKEALNLLRATLPATIEIKQDISRESTQVLADPTQIHQIIMNLCTNAAQAMRGKGGLLDIHLSGIEILQPALSGPPDLQAGSYVQLSVRDTGHGIDAAIKDKIFDPFFTTKEAKEGTGLGLSVVYGIVKSYGGAIDVQSAVGQGATFTVYLPRINSVSHYPAMNPEEVDLEGTERILFVDDEEALVNMTRTYFKSLGYEITATVSSAWALRLFQGDPRAFDLVITDMTMPEITGAELVRTLLKLRPELPIILCTGYSDSINMAEARKLNIREFVYKPFSLHDLGVLVRRVLGS